MKSSCERCAFRAYTERKPTSILARIWRWHAKWCPGWKAYQAELSELTKSPNAGPNPAN